MLIAGVYQFDRKLKIFNLQVENKIQQRLIYREWVNI